MKLLYAFSGHVLNCKKIFEVASNLIFFQSETLVHHSRYSEEELMPTMKKMARLVTKAKTGKLTAVHTKYKSSKFNRISVVPELKSSVITSLAETDFEESEEQ